MAWDLTTGLIHTGLQAGQQDQDVIAAMDIALEIAELYCDRRFLYKQEAIRFYDITTESLKLPRYPVEQLFSVNPPIGRRHLHRDAGTVQLHGQQFIDEVEIIYAGGFRILPATLERALWDIFGLVWSTYYGTVASAGQPPPTVNVGEVKRKTIVGVGSIEYTTSADAVSGSNSNRGADTTALIPESALVILDMYRRWAA